MLGENAHFLFVPIDLRCEDHGWVLYVMRGYRALRFLFYFTRNEEVEKKIRFFSETEEYV